MDRTLAHLLFLPLIFQGVASRDSSGLHDSSLLIEIVSCEDLIKADRNTSDPYVKVMMGEKEVHKTKNIPNTYVPISIMYALVPGTP